jgi:hypothetical protein
MNAYEKEINANGARASEAQEGLDNLKSDYAKEIKIYNRYEAGKASFHDSIKDLHKAQDKARKAGNESEYFKLIDDEREKLKDYNSSFKN